MRSLGRRVAAEALGTAFLLVAVVGSGIMGERLAGGSVAIALLANSIATGAGLAVLILIMGQISGAHFNPVVTLFMMVRRQHPRRDLLPYWAAQLVGAFAGIALAHGMFDLPAYTWSAQPRSGFGQAGSEALATFGLLSVIRGCQAHRPAAMPLAVGAYITGAYWFTSSTSFANPVVTLARMATDTFTGIRPADAPAFVLAQFAGMGLALGVWWWMLPEEGGGDQARG